MSDGAAPLRLVPPVPSVPDDRALVEAARAGRREALTALYDRCAPMLHGVLRRTLGPDLELDDVLHDAFLRLVDSLGNLSEPRALPGFATRIAAHTALDALRRRRRRRWLRFFAPEDLEEPEPVGVDDEARQALRRFDALLEAVLSPEERVAFSLRVVGGLELTEVAEACGCSLATVKRRVGRAEERLRPRLEADELLGRWLREGTRWEADDA
jgi:RNA polymerase sigma-70 factor (ECF subfamily)